MAPERPRGADCEAVRAAPRGLLLDLSEAYRPAAKFWGYKNASRSICRCRRVAERRSHHRGDWKSQRDRGAPRAQTELSVRGIETLANGCMKRGYRCMCVTDHSYGLPIAGGMAMDEMRAQHAEIDKLNTKFGGEFRVLAAFEPA